jgi:hypothetical protein
MKHRRTFFMLGWTLCGFHKKHSGTCYAELVFFHLRVTWCILVCSGREMLTHYFSYSGEPGAVSIKNALGHIMPNLYFCLRWDLRVT